jgi:hypothetical protein
LDLEHYAKVRDSLLNLLQAGVEGSNFQKLFTESQKLSGKEETLENSLGVLYSVLQDILHIEAGARGEPLRNADRPGQIRQLARLLGAQGVMQAMTSLAELERSLRRNVPARLSLEAFAVSLAADRRMS